MIRGPAGGGAQPNAEFEKIRNGFQISAGLPEIKAAFEALDKILNAQLEYYKTLIIQTVNGGDVKDLYVNSEYNLMSDVLEGFVVDSQRAANRVSYMQQEAANRVSDMQQEAGRTELLEIQKGFLDKFNNLGVLHDLCGDLQKLAGGQKGYELRSVEDVLELVKFGEEKFAMDIVEIMKETDKFKGCVEPICTKVQKVAQGYQEASQEPPRPGKEDLRPLWSQKKANCDAFLNAVAPEMVGGESKPKQPILYAHSALVAKQNAFESLVGKKLAGPVYGSAYEPSLDKMIGKLKKK